jgi:hypothetical protein
MLLVLFNSTRALAGLAAGQGAAGAQLVALRSVAGAASGSSPVSGRMVRVESWRATATGAGATSGAIRASRAMRAVAAGSATVFAHPALLGMLHGTATGAAPVRAQLARVRPLAAAATGSAVLVAPLAPVRGLTGVAAGGSQLEGVLGVVMRHLARTPGVRLIVIRKEVRTLAVDPEVRVVAIPARGVCWFPPWSSGRSRCGGNPEHRRMTTFHQRSRCRSGLLRRLVEVAGWRSNRDERVVRQRSRDSNRQTTPTLRPGPPSGLRAA